MLRYNTVMYLFSCLLIPFIENVWMQNPKLSSLTELLNFGLLDNLVW
jgi:hypothetical protein